MKIYAEPKINVAEDGTITVASTRLTPAVVNKLMKNLLGYKSARYDLNQIVEIIQNASDKKEAEKELCKRFKLTCSQAHFLTESSIKETAKYCNPELWEKEMNMLKALHELLLDEAVEEDDL